MKFPPRRLAVLLICSVSAIVVCLNSLTTPLYISPTHKLLLNRNHSDWSRNSLGAFFVKPPLETIVPNVEDNLLRTKKTVSARAKCSPVHDIFFLKTHKTGSSTVLNILLRYADEHNRTVAVPRIRSNLMNYPRPFREHFMLNFTLIKRRPEVFAVHTRFDLDEIKRVMSPKAKFVTIIRHPLQVWESGYNYFRMHTRTQLPLDEFVFNDTAVKKMQRREYSKWFGFNMMFFDMGFVQNTKEPTQLQAQKAIDMLEKNFDFVMVAEFMEESLVLLKDKLCWELESMVAFRHNERNSSVHSKNVSDSVASRILFYNDIDMRIYDHFLRKFLLLLNEYGDELIFKEARALKHRNEYWAARCIGGHKHGYSNTVEYLPAKNAPDICNRLTMREVLYIYKFRSRYISELRKVFKAARAKDHRSDRRRRIRRRRRRRALRHKSTAIPTLGGLIPPKFENNLEQTFDRV